MGDFQLILLSDRQRPGRIVQPDGQFSLIRFPAEIRMAAASSVEREIPAEEIAAWYTPIQAYVYPPEHGDLLDEILAAGVALTEMPLDWEQEGINGVLAN